MLPGYIKISQFPNGGSPTLADIETGLRGGVNTNFNAIGPSGLFGWNIVTSNTVMQNNNGYVPQSGSTIILTLPLNSVFGDILWITGAYFSATVPWVIQCGPAQVIYDGTVLTNISGSGNITPDNKTTSVQLLCTAANTAYQVLNSNGNLLFA